MFLYSNVSALGCKYLLLLHVRIMLKIFWRFKEVQVSSHLRVFLFPYGIKWNCIVFVEPHGLSLYKRNTVLSKIGHPLYILVLVHIILLCGDYSNSDLDSVWVHVPLRWPLLNYISGSTCPSSKGLLHRHIKYTMLWEKYLILLSVLRFYNKFLAV